MNNSFKQIIREGHKKKINCIDWNSNGLILAIGSLDKDILIYKHLKNNLFINEFQKLYLKGHKSPIIQISFNSVEPDIIASISQDQILTFWNLNNPKRPFYQQKVLICIKSISWSSDGQILILRSINKIMLIKKDQPKKILRILEVPWNICEFKFARNDEILIIPHEGFLNFYEIAKLTNKNLKNPILTLQVCSGQCKTLDINSSFNYLVTGGSDGIISFWSTINLYCKNSFSFRKHEVSINKVKISSDGKYIAFYGEDQNITILNKFGHDNVDIILKITTKTKKTCMIWNPKYNVLAYTTIPNVNGHINYNRNEEVCKLWAPINWSF